MAVRGTDFWWGPIDGRFGVLLVHNSKLDVSNGAGGVTLDKAGEGTDVDPLKGGGAPGEPYQWPPEKIARALSATSFGAAAPASSAPSPPPAAAARARSGARPRSGCVGRAVTVPAGPNLAINFARNYWELVIATGPIT